MNSKRSPSGAWLTTAAELQQSPTSSLLHIRRKWEHQQALSRAEWVLLAQYVQVSCEERSGNTRCPSPDSFIAVLEAVLAVRSLRTGRGGGLDRFYLGTLPSDSAFGAQLAGVNDTAAVARQCAFWRMAQERAIGELPGDL